MLTAKRLRELLDYDAATGEFTWRVAKAQKLMNNRRAATAVNSDGYRHIKIDNKSHKAHRLAWLHVHGEWPSGQIDHIDGDRANNRISNLRSATWGENRHNLKRYTNNTSGHKGVYQCNQTGKWKVQINAYNKRRYLGAFERIEDAAETYARAAKDLHGEFRRDVS